MIIDENNLVVLCLQLLKFKKTSYVIYSVKAEEKNKRIGISMVKAGTSLF